MDDVSNSAPSLPIDADLPCSACDYNLKGLSGDANCPECGQPIARTLRFGLMHSQSSWLQQQASAVPWLAALAAIGYVSRSSFGYLRDPVAIYTGHVLAIAATAAVLVGCWRLSVPEPGATSVDEGGSIRRGLRLAALVLLVLNVAALPFVHRATGLNFESPSGLLVFAPLILLSVTDILALMLLWHLARRSGSRSLRAHARVVLYVFPVLPLRGLLFFWISPVDAGGIREYVMAFYQAVDFFTAAALFAMLLLLGRMYEVLRAAAAVSADAARV